MEKNISQNAENKVVKICHNRKKEKQQHNLINIITDPELLFPKSLNFYLKKMFNYKGKRVKRKRKKIIRSFPTEKEGSV